MRSIAPVALVAATVLLALALLDVAFTATFPHFARLRYTFSAAYLAREIDRLRPDAGTVVLGDSTIWGYGVSEEEAAVSLARAHGRTWTNLAYAGGSPVNTLVMLRLLLAKNAVPRTVVFTVNQKEFNVADSSYKRLEPAVEQLAWSALDTIDRARLEPALAQSADAKIDRAVERGWKLYGMRADVRDVLFHDVDAAHAVAAILARLSGTAAARERAHRAVPAAFEGTYDLSPLDDRNASFAALVETAKLLRGRSIRSYAILVPTNHALLHDYIDVPEYRANLETVRNRLRSFGVTVIDLDTAVLANEFIDNDHLTARGNRRLASLLEARIPQ